MHIIFIIIFKCLFFFFQTDSPQPKDIHFTMKYEQKDVSSEKMESTIGQFNWLIRQRSVIETSFSTKAEVTND